MCPSNVKFILTTLSNPTRKTTLCQFLQSFSWDKIYIAWFVKVFTLHYLPGRIFVMAQPKRLRLFTPSLALNQYLGKSLFQNGMHTILLHYFIYGAASASTFGPGSGYLETDYCTMVMLFMCWAQQGQFIIHQCMK